MTVGGDPQSPAARLVFEDAALRHAGRTLVGPLSLSLGAPGITAILGPNGAGKSLTLRLAHGLVMPHQGHVGWTAPMPEQAFVHQHPILLRRSVAANIRFAMKLRGIPARHWAERLHEALHQTGLEKLADHNARTLSIGQQQRAALARAWALRPQVLFLDEPTASLDPRATGRVENVIQKFSEEGIICIITTHDMGQARRLATRVVFMQDGRIEEDSDARPFFAQPVSQAARNFLEGTL